MKDLISYWLKWFSWKLHRLSPHPYSDNSIIFLSGVGRSGTTILRKCLESHRNIISTKCGNNVVYDLLEAGSRSISMRRKAIKQTIFQHNYLFHQMILNLAFPYTKYKKLSLPALFCDLSIHSLTYLQSIKGLNSKVVYIVRNGIEVVASRMESIHFKKFSFSENCRIWSTSRDIVEYSKKNSSCFVIYHHDLLNTDNLNKIFSNLEDFLGIEHDASCIDYIHNTYCHPTVLRNSDNTKSSLNNRSYRWNSWTDCQRSEFLDICSGAMNYLNFEIPENVDSSNKSTT